jgi:PAS domain S-box-containing protein
MTLAGKTLDHANSPMAEVLKTGTPIRNFRVVIERPGGSCVTVLANIEPLFDETGAQVGAVNCFQDVTELRRASQELQRSKDDLEDFFENGAVGLHVVGSDGKILRANKAELEMLGYSSEEYIGRDIAEFHVDQPVINDILSKLGDGEKLDRYPARLRAKDGSIRHVLITSNAQFRDGHFVKTRCFTFDVTDAKRAEERVREGEQLFCEVLEAMPVAIYTTDAGGKITYFNQAATELAGRTPVLGSDEWCVTWRLYWPDGTRLPHDECPMAVTLKEGKAVRGVEAIAERPDGSRVRFAPYPTPLFDQNGRLTGAVNMLLDITERHEADLQSARLAAIVGSSDDAIISTTLSGRVVTWNAGAERMLGYKAAEIVGKS